MWNKQVSRAVLAFLICLLIIPSVSVSADSVRITDDFANPDLLYSSTAGWTFDGSNPVFFGGDDTRMVRTATTTESVVYHLSDIQSYAVRVHYFSGTTAAIKFYGSQDALVWDEISSIHDLTTAVSNGWYKTTYSPAVSLPSGINYLKVEISGDSNNWSMQLGYATISKDSSTNEPGSMTDNANDWSVSYSHSANMTVDTTNPDFFNGDNSRFTRSSTATGEVVYSLADMSQFTARIYLFGSVDVNKVEFYSSPDGTSWTLAAGSRSNPVATLNGWKFVDYSPTAILPPGTNYLKVELSDSTDGWATQLGNITISTDGEMVNPFSEIQSLTINSVALGKTMRLNVYLPPGYSANETYPTLYMFHGFQGDENGWLNGLQVKETADDLLSQGLITPMIIISPQMDNSFGINSASQYSLENPSDPVNSLYNGRYEDYIFQDLIPYIDSHYSTVATKESRYVGGLSMGGFIALHSAFTHPDMISKVGGTSAAVILNDGSLTVQQYSWLYPNEATRLERDPLALAQSQDLTGMKVYLDCGSSDSYRFYRGNGQLAQILDQRSVSNEYHLYPGGHTFEYWKSNVRSLLLFFAGTSE
ncbi:enterochelin esterase-like enzyme [Paenibacillus anaericanus]|uniref:alpha/beta hydrolase n=1 Tax=Paenibacillus anaericanus TaxID=170367 RepID=UPI0027884A18|nr:alpha/beta hydrolase-fold protein [Paenibacillus anaericanus]MDQ0091318.1 enterochelin esterase-like enzyme [Paenibacillus anaericanus]